MNRLSTLVLQYYRVLLFNNLLFSIMCWVLIVPKFSAPFVVTSFVAKLIGLVAAASHHYYMYSNSFYYFRNAGISIKRLYIYSFITDLLFYAIFITACTFISHAIAYFKG